MLWVHFKLSFLRFSEMHADDADLTDLHRKIKNILWQLIDYQRI